LLIPDTVLPCTYTYTHTDHMAQNSQNPPALPIPRAAARAAAAAAADVDVLATPAVATLAFGKGGIVQAQRGTMCRPGYRLCATHAPVDIKYGKKVGSSVPPWVQAAATAATAAALHVVTGVQYMAIKPIRPRGNTGGPVLVYELMGETEHERRITAGMAVSIYICCLSLHYMLAAACCLLLLVTALYMLAAACFWLLLLLPDYDHHPYRHHPHISPCAPTGLLLDPYAGVLSGTPYYANTAPTASAAANSATGKVPSAADFAGSARTAPAQDILRIRAHNYGGYCEVRLLLQVTRGVDGATRQVTMMRDLPAAAAADPSTMQPGGHTPGPNDSAAGTAAIEAVSKAMAMAAAAAVVTSKDTLRKEAAASSASSTEPLRVMGPAGKMILVHVPKPKPAPAPTPRPTAPPTTSPTSLPTASTPHPTSSPSNSPTAAPTGADYACKQCLKWERPCKGRGEGCEMLSRIGSCSAQTCNCLESAVCSPP
jgi:hypothetical protein